MNDTPARPELPHQQIAEAYDKWRKDTASDPAKHTVFGAGFLAGRAQALEEAATAVEDHNRVGRAWVPGSLWDNLSHEAGARIRALIPSTKEGHE